MKFSIITFCLFISNFIQLVFCGCFFPRISHEFDVTLQKVKNVTYFVEMLHTMENYIIPDGQYIEIYCDQGFTGNYINRDQRSGIYRTTPNYYNTETLNNVKIIELHCKNKNIEYRNNGKTINQERITCEKSSAALYPFEIPNCNKSGFLYGLNIKNQPIVFAEFCYDLRMSDVIFAHYLAGKRSPILEDQKQFNLDYIDVSLNSTEKITFLNTNNGFRDNKKIQFESIGGIIEFQIGDLIQINFKNHSKFFKRFLSNTSVELNSVIWWSSLKNGNWKAFEKLFEKQTLKNEYDVFAGKSAVVTYPASEICEATNELVLQVNGNEKSVPLYIWHYLKPRNNNKRTDEEVVVIGINSPFFETIPNGKEDKINNNNSTIICKDICDDISWLHPLSKTRKMAGLGYIFCCKPDEVKNVLEGFPNLNQIQEELFNKRIETTSVPPTTELTEEMKNYYLQELDKLYL